MDIDSDEDYGEQDSEDEEEEWLYAVKQMRRNYFYTTMMYGKGQFSCIQNMSDEEWEELGRDISNNTHVTKLCLTSGALNDHKMSFFFRGLTRSSSIKDMQLYVNQFGIAGLRSLVPFLQNTNNLTRLDLDHAKKELCCQYCDIASIEIDKENKPEHLKHLYLSGNNINIDGCRELAKLLQGGDATLETLSLLRNKIDDSGLEILVGALQNNTSLETFYISQNDSISRQGHIMLLKLVNNIASIEETLRSNHTLITIDISLICLNDALRVNSQFGRDPEEAGRQKIIQTQLNSERREVLCRLQGVDHCVFSEIDPLHLPEVLSLIDRKHGQGELYDALLSSIVSLFSTMNREGCIQQKKERHVAKIAEYEAKIADHKAKVEELENELAAMRELAAVRNYGNDVVHRSNKRRRT